MLYPVELVALAMCVTAAALYYVYKVPYLNPLELYLLSAIPALLVYTAGLMIAAFFFTPESEQSETQFPETAPESRWLIFLKRFLSPRDILADLRHINALLLTLLGYQELKNLTPLISPTLFDGVFIRWERLIFSGRLFAQVLWEPFYDVLGRYAAPFMSFCYTDFIPYIFLLCAVMILQRDKQLRTNFCLAFALMWLIGIMVTYGFPTLGPCFVEPRLFDRLPRTDVNYLKEFLAYGMLLQKKNPLDANAYFLIAGLPSLHLAATILGSIFLFRVNIYLGIISWLVCLGTAVSTLYFGWHYVIDNLAAILVAAFAMQIANNWLEFTSRGELLVFKRRFRPAPKDSE